MGEINNENFNKKFPEIKSSLESAKIIAVDLEFSALHPLKNEAPRLVLGNNTLLFIILLDVYRTSFLF